MLKCAVWSLIYTIETYHVEYSDADALAQHVLVLTGSQDRRHVLEPLWTRSPHGESRHDALV